MSRRWEAAILDTWCRLKVRPPRIQRKNGRCAAFVDRPPPFTPKRVNDLQLFRQPDEVRLEPSHERGCARIVAVEVHVIVEEPFRVHGLSSTIHRHPDSRSEVPHGVLAPSEVRERA